MNKFILMGLSALLITACGQSQKENSSSKDVIGSNDDHPSVAQEQLPKPVPEWAQEFNVEPAPNKYTSVRKIAEMHKNLHIPNCANKVEYMWSAEISNGSEVRYWDGEDWVTNSPWIKDYDISLCTKDTIFPRGTVFREEQIITEASCGWSTKKKLWLDTKGQVCTGK